MPRIACRDCNGTGFAMPLMDRDCEECSGIGQVTIEQEQESKPTLPDTSVNKLIIELCDIEDLNDWEASFADDIYKWAENGRTPTDKQVAKAKQIIDKYK